MSDATPPAQPPRIAVIGGGLSGLAATHRLQQLLPAAVLRLYEAGSRLGGPLSTRYSGELPLEQGADSFLTRDRSAIDLCRELRMEDELLATSADNRRALVVWRGKLERVPDGFVLMQPHNLRALWRSPVLSLLGKLRVAAEPLVRAPVQVAAPEYDESVANFATRRLGREAFDRLVEPLLAGIYVADATQLSLSATMPEFLAAERDHGSLHRARQASASASAADAGARYAEFLTLRRGMEHLVGALSEQIPTECVRFQSRVTEIERSGENRWRVKALDPAGNAAAEQFDGVIVSIPAGQAGPLLRRVDSQLAGDLEKIRAASSVVVTLVYRREQIRHPLDGFGFVVPRAERRQIVAASFPSVKFPGRGDDLTPVRVFLGGALHPGMIAAAEGQLLDIAHSELSALLGLHGEPREAMVARWPESMPQYRVGHVQLVAAIEHRASNHYGLALAGNSYRGVGIPQCIRSGRTAAERLAALWQRSG